jgi:hypothetical protein
VNRTTSTQRKAATAKRLEFLRAYPQFWDLPSEKMDVTEARSAALAACIAALKDAGLYSTNSDKQDLRWGVRVLVGMIRKEHGYP